MELIDSKYTREKFAELGVEFNDWQKAAILWNKPLLYQEMIDVAETILSLEEYKIWIEENVEESKSKQAKLAKIKKDIKFVQNTIKETISEFESVCSIIKTP